MIRIALDVMGGDNAPDANLGGALDALSRSEDIFVQLVGQKNVIDAWLRDKTYDDKRLQVIDAPEVIETGEHPVTAIQKKKNSSMVIGLRMLHDGESDAFVSAGSTGALLVGGQTIAGRLPGIKRAPLAVQLPTTKGKSLLVDCGANVDARPEMLVQFAIMGSLYARHLMGIENPTVGLVNIGTEEEKGNELTRAAYPLLKDCDKIRFIGNAEARDIPQGTADVLVCEAFTGNVILKMYEGVARTLLSQVKSSLMQSLRGKIGGLLIKPSLKGLVSTFSSKEDGGAPLLGLRGLVIKAHGNSTEVQMRNALLECEKFYNSGLKERIQDAFT
ncbi:MAG: phosphate acyltransferase PlsX [Lachnospiraceae bacterium]|jgi:glycerol-3-phosphate acyltransferase PlsX|nr:phosphate acyltransferase PlsX [Lachnospiraceae bacterium]MBR6977224.1 phosphate acyltransferase PlsX [Lachnospiraceae bacterium]